MPPKDLQIFPEIFVFHPDGRKIPIRTLEPLPDFSCDVDEDPVVERLAQELFFETACNLTQDTIYYLKHGKFPSNNWRKMHGYPLRRKTGRRKEG